MSSHLSQVHETLANRYKEIIIDNIDKFDGISKDNLLRAYDMCEVLTDDAVQMYDDKMGRWVGFIQGILFCHGLLDIDTERDYSRKLFHDAYIKMGLKKPDTIAI